MKKSIIRIAFYFLVAGLFIIISEKNMTQFIVLGLLMVITFIEINDLYSMHIKLTNIEINKQQTVIKKNQSKMARDKTRFLSLVDTIGSGLLLVNINGLVKYINKEFIEYFPGEYEGFRFEDVVKDKELKAFIKSAYAREKKMKSQLVVDEKSYELIATPLFESKVFIGCIILVHDITIILESEKLQKVFIADASHELRTPITAIKGMSEILIRDKHIDESVQTDFLEVINKESNRLEEIVEDLLAISRLESNDKKIKIEKIDLKDLVEEVLKSLKVKSEVKNLKMVVDVDNININVDRLLFYTLLVNLIKNAVSYTDSGNITIKAKRLKNKVFLKITDTGIGIPNSEQELIFERFYRVDKDRNRDSGGTGLGLSICKKIVDKHNGFITVKSEVGKGTEFEIIIIDKSDF